MRYFHACSLEAQLNSLQHTLENIDGPTQQLLASSFGVLAGDGQSGSGAEEKTPSKE
jgi:hypothetical protein